eukprot:TRINITY_DN5264_c0_g2_i3.p1 TRINITY_DN5264_c0_g2~~TRINITY_DN5264_c0_g2_i3.p1  ORF type:complete len:1056 (+),score=470.23 TRINITY_DN5264_c0_g2_i3:78-3245(+)
MSVETVDNINISIKKATSFVKKRVNYESNKGLFGFSIEISQIPPAYFWNRDNLGKLIRRLKKLGLDTSNFSMNRNVLNITWYSSDEVERLMNSKKESKINLRFISNGKILNGLIRKHLHRNGDDNEEIYNYNIQYRDNGIDEKKSIGKFKSKRIYFNEENGQDNEDYGQDVNKKETTKNNHKNHKQHNNARDNNYRSSNNNINHKNNRNGTDNQSPLYKKLNNDNSTSNIKNNTPKNNNNTKKSQSEDDKRKNPQPIVKKQEDNQIKSKKEIPKNDIKPNNASSNPRTYNSDSNPPKTQITTNNNKKINNDTSPSQFDDTPPKEQIEPKENPKVEENSKEIPKGVHTEAPKKTEIPKEKPKPKENPKENKQVHTEAPTRTEAPKEDTKPREKDARVNQIVEEKEIPKEIPKENKQVHTEAPTRTETPKEDQKPREKENARVNPKVEEKEVPEENKQVHAEAPKKTETPKEETAMSIEEKKRLLFQKNEENKKETKTSEQLNEERRKKKEETEKKWREQQDQKEKEKQEQENLKREQQKKVQEETRLKKLEKERLFIEQREKGEREKEEQRKREIEERNKEFEMKEKKRREVEEENKKIEQEYRQRVLLEHQEREKKEKEERKKKIEETERKWKEMKDEVDSNRTPEFNRTDIGKVDIPSSLTNNNEQKSEVHDDNPISSKVFNTPLKIEDKRDDLPKTTQDTKNDDTPLRTNSNETKKKDTYVPRGSLDTVHSSLVLPEPIRHNPYSNEDEELNLTSRSSGRTLNTQNLSNIKEVFNTSAKEIEQPLTTEETVNLVLPSQAKQLRETERTDSGSETEFSKKHLKKQFLKMSNEANNNKTNLDHLNLPSNNSRIKSWDGNKLREEKEKQQTETQLKRNSGNSHRIKIQDEPIKPIRKKTSLKRRSGSFDLSCINEIEEHEAKEKEYNSDTQDFHSVNELLMNKKDISDPREIAKVLKDRRVYRNSLKVINQDYLKINTDNVPLRETSSSDLNSPKKILQEKENRRRRVLSSRMYPSVKKKDASPREGHNGDSLLSPRDGDSPRDSLVSPRRSNDKI